MLSLPLLSLAEEVAELKKIKTAFQRSLVEIDLSAGKRRKELRFKYAEALSKLGKELQAKGDLDGVLLVQSEKQAISKGEIPAKRLENEKAANLRSIYQSSLDKIEAGVEAEKKSKAEIYRRQLENLVTTLTKAGRVDDAIMVRKEQEASRGIADVSAIAVIDGSSKNGIRRLVQLPKELPPVAEDPFKNPKWTESLTVAGDTYRLNHAVHIGAHRKGILVYLAEGGRFSRSEGKFHLWEGRLVVKDCEFQGIPFRADFRGNDPLRRLPFG